MTILQRLKSSVRRLRPSVAQDAERLVRLLAQHRLPRLALNEIYNRLTLAQQAVFWSRFALVFRGTDAHLAPGIWHVTFAGKRIDLPLGTGEAWLEWVHAVSALGHEIEVKRSYEVLVRSPERPKVFFDIGANYGLHSLLLARHGLRTVAFEPNPACHPYLEEARALNQLDFPIEHLALDERNGTRELWFPASDTWLGTLEPDVAGQLDASSLRRIDVATTTLDLYVEAHGLVPDLLKIDTEGSEARVLTGARETLASHRPLILFESWSNASIRDSVYTLLDRARYRIGHLPLPTKGQLDRDAFIGSRQANFLAAPEELWGVRSFL